jgi:hypothetical protein
MKRMKLLAFSAAALAVSATASFAGSCLNDIDRMQARVDARVEAIAAGGPFVPAGVSAGMGVQPTPFGMAQVEAKMGEVSWQTVDAVREAMVRARAANAAGNRKVCEKELASARRLMVH